MIHITNDKKRSRDPVIDDGEHGHDSIIPKMKRVKLSEKTTQKQCQKAVIVVVDPCILTSMNLIFPPMDIVDDFIIADATTTATASRRSRSRSRSRPTVESERDPTMTTTTMSFLHNPLLLLLSRQRN
jgi:hypothetical protein